MVPFVRSRRPVWPDLFYASSYARGETHGMNDQNGDETLAARLLTDAETDEQVAYRLGAHDDADALRAGIRSLARSRGTRIRTAVMDGVLVVVLADAAIWSEPAAVMRRKLTPVD
jgi:hypothetical protein